MVWFRQAASHYPSQCCQIYVTILRHSVLNNCHNINGDSRITDICEDKPLVIGCSHKTQWCGAYVFALLLVWIICWTTVELPMVEDAMTPMSFHCIDYLSVFKCYISYRKLHWLSWISILPFKDGKLFMINLSSAMPADNQSTESTRPSTSIMSTM